MARLLARAGAVPLALLAACIDYNPTGKPEDSVPWGIDDTEPPDSGPPDTSDDTAPPPEESCDGVDNDGDGEVDEGFPDADADAVADCVDTECVVALDGDEAVSDTYTCTNVVAPPADPWNVELMWEADPMVTCRFAAVADLDADGTVEIVCTGAYEGDRAWVLDGATGAIEARWDVFREESHVAIADLDRDGDLEVVGFDPDFYPVVVDAAGAPVWRGAMALAQGTYSSHLEIRDLGADGEPEVVTHKGAVRGTDGAVVGRFDASGEAQPLEFQIAAEDLDLDGDLELAYQWSAWDTASGLLWQVRPSGSDHGFAIPLPVQADADDEAELFWTTMDHFQLAEADGTVVDGRAYSGTDATTVSVPCAGDIDGDGEMEVVSVGSNAFHAWSALGELEWTVPMLDETPNWGGCTTFDFDLDGAKEVVALDQDAVYVLDGRTGATLVRADDGFDSATMGDQPLVVDLDGDGSVEILVTSPSTLYDTALHAWRNVNRDWPPGTQMWPSATWSGTSLLPDGRVPRTPHAPWLTTQVWRGQPEAPVFGADLRPVVGDTCVASCADDGGEVRVEVRLENLGPDEAEAGAPLAVYGLDTGGGRVLLSVLTLPDWLDDGRAAASWEVVTTTEQAKRGLVFVAGDDGTGSLVSDDCETGNNELTWVLTACP